MGLWFRFWDRRRFLDIFDLMFGSDRARGGARRGVTGVALCAEQVVKALLFAAGDVEGLSGFGFTEQGFHLAALGAFFEIGAAEIGSLLLDGSNVLAKDGGGAAGGSGFDESGDAVGGGTGLRTERDRFPAPAFSRMRGLQRGAQPMQCGGGCIERGAALFLFEGAQMKQAREAIVGGHWLDLGRERGEAAERDGEAHVLRGILREKGAKRGAGAEGAIEFGIGSGLVSADADQVFRARVGGHEPAQAGCLVEVRRLGYGGHEPADGIEYGDGRIPALGSERAGENHVAVEKRAHGIDQRILLVVAFHQHGVEGGDGAAMEFAGALDEAGKAGEDRRRVSLGGWRLAGGEADFARSHGKAGERVQHQENVPAARRKVFRDRGGGKGGAKAQKRRLIGGGDKDDGAREAFRAERVFKEIAHLAAALADQAYDGDICLGVAGHHADQRAFADTGAAEDADTLAAAHGEKRIDGADAGAERRLDRGAIERGANPGFERTRRKGLERRAAVNGLTQGIEDAPEKRIAGCDGGKDTERGDGVTIADAFA
jgi:hypothetical protein